MYIYFPGCQGFLFIEHARKFLPKQQFRDWCHQQQFDLQQFQLHQFLPKQQFHLHQFLPKQLQQFQPKQLQRFQLQKRHGLLDCQHQSQTHLWCCHASLFIFDFTFKLILFFS